MKYFSWAIHPPPPLAVRWLEKLRKKIFGIDQFHTVFTCDVDMLMQYIYMHYFFKIKDRFRKKYTHLQCIRTAIFLPFKICKMLSNQGVFYPQRKNKDGSEYYWPWVNLPAPCRQHDNIVKLVLINLIKCHMLPTILLVYNLMKLYMWHCEGILQNRERKKRKKYKFSYKTSEYLFSSTHIVFQEKWS